MAEDEREAPDAWYAVPAPETDVVLSTKVRMARNLANFPFPHKLRDSDGERIQSIVFDAFNHLPDGERFQAISVDRLDALGARILQERGVLETDSCSNAGIILRNDGRVSCAVNVVDHVRISTFAAGLDFEGAEALAQEVDAGLQKRVQFAASYDFGYLTSSVLDAGSGLRLSVRMHLPSLAMQGRIRSLVDELQEKGIAVSSSFGTGGMEFLGGAGGMGTALGSYYEFSSVNSQQGSEFDQMTAVASAATKVKEMERAAREDCLHNQQSKVRNSLYRAVALGRSSLFVPLREAIAIVGCIKHGLVLGLLEGLSDEALHAMLFRMQEGHLEYVLRNGNFHFEKDIAHDGRKQIERLRALILQEAFQDVRLAS